MDVKSKDLYAAGADLEGVSKVSRPPPPPQILEVPLLFRIFMGGF